MNRIKKTFERTRSSHKAALIPFITAGFPNLELSLQLMHALVDGGADIIELGIPFSDPMADGPVIQAANDVALGQGVSLARVLNLVSDFRKTNKKTPVVLMGYLNPIEQMGYEIFAVACKEAGVDGVLTVDLPPEESTLLLPLLKANAVSAIFLISPLTPEARIEAILEKAEGYIYTIAYKGVTGADNMDTLAVSQSLNKLQKKTDLPLAIGFGIKTPETAAILAEHSDAIIIGSALIEFIRETSKNNLDLIENTKKYISKFKQKLKIS